MLLSFSAANVLSIREEQTLSFVATELNDGSARPTKIKEAAGPSLSCRLSASTELTPPARPRFSKRSLRCGRRCCGQSTGSASVNQCGATPFLLDADAST